MSTTKEPPGFLSLPAEVRLRIYKCLFTSAKPITIQYHKENTFNNRPCRPGDYHHKANLSSQFLRCNRTILTEAIPFLFTENEFIVTRVSRDLAAIKRLAPVRSDNMFIRHLSYETLYLYENRIKELRVLKNLKAITLYHRTKEGLKTEEDVSKWLSHFLSSYGDGNSLGFLMRTRAEVRVECMLGVWCKCPGRAASIAYNWNATPHIELRFRLRLNEAGKAIPELLSLADMSGDAICGQPLLSEPHATSLT